MLVHHPDTERICVVGVVYAHFLAVFEYFARLRLIEAEQHAHESGFSRAVFAEQRMYLAAAQAKVDVVVCHDAGKYLCYAPHFDDIRG